MQQVKRMAALAHCDLSLPDECLCACQQFAQCVFVSRKSSAKLAASLEADLLKMSDP